MTNILGGTRILGVLNVTRDSFSDGGRYLEPEAAVAQGMALMADADAVDVGAASSHPDAEGVSADEEVARLAPVMAALREAGVPISVDTWQPEVQRWACEHGARWVNDIHGFPDRETRRFLADRDVGLIAMFAVQRAGGATRVRTEPGTIVQRVTDFFDARLEALERDGVRRERVIVDPGMGFFLGAGPEPSVEVLRAIPMLRARYGVPVLVGVSRKSFLRALTGATLDTQGPATLAAEVLAAASGVDWLRTHDAASLRQALHVVRAVSGAPALA